MGVVDAGGCISATRHGTAMFEWSQHIYMIGSTRRRKRHVHAISTFVMALLESGTEAGRMCGATTAKQVCLCVDPRQQGRFVSTPGTPDMILQQREAGSISTQCSVSSRGKMLNEEDTRLGR